MTDARLTARRAAELLAGLVVAALVGSLTLAAVSALPFADSSWLPETFGATLAAGFVVLAGWLLLRRATGDRALWLLGTAGPAFLASSHLGLLLHGTPHYLRIDAPASPAEKAAFKQLTAERVTAATLAGEPIVGKLTRAAGNDASIGGLKVVTENGWFAARPSGTEDIYKIYAESFTSAVHLQQVVAEAKQIVSAALGV